MQKRLFSLLVLCLAMVSAMAQKVTVSGCVVDGSVAEGEALSGATVVLLQPKDSTQVTGCSSDMEGKFSLPAVKVGNYILRVSYMGYRTFFRDLILKKGEKSVDVGKVQLQEDARLMSEAEIIAKLAQVEMKEDTFVYNADAYRLPEGSTLEVLVKKLPGAEVDEDGTIKVNGKTVTKIMVEGKEFFDNDTKMAMKNLPTKMVKKIKAYDKKSDYSRVTGIDDGEEETVLDLSVQKGMKEGWLINVDLGYGTEDRYTGKANVSRFLDNSQFTLIGSRNNVNDNGFPGGGRGGWGGGGGITTSTMAGANFSWDNGKKEDMAGYLKMGGNARYAHRKSETETKSNSETFLSETKSTYTNSHSISTSRSWNVNANFRLEWQPDSMTTINFRPNFSYSNSSSDSWSSSVTFNQDPYAVYDGKVMTDPLLEYNLEENRMIRDQIAVNDNNRAGLSESTSKSIDGRLMLNRRMGKPGRNITLNVGGGYNDSDSKSFSRSKINYYQAQQGNQRDNFTNQYNLSPSESHNVSTRLSYTEPIIGALNLQFSYQFQYRYSDNDRSMYSIDSLLTKYQGYYTEEQLVLGYLPGLDTLNYIRNAENSQYATYREYNHDAGVMLRYKVGDNRLNVGVSLQPQTTHMDYLRNRLDTMVVRHTFNWSPRIDYRWKISNASQLRVRFNGRMSQPSMTDLLEVTNTSDPLNISTGNSGLRSSWNNNFNVFYNGNNTERQMGWMVNAYFDQTKNSISTATIYNAETGGRYTRPMNINGNWSTGSALMFNTAMGEKKAFNIHNFANIRYSHNVGYLSSNVGGLSLDGIVNADGSLNQSALRRLFAETHLDKATTKATNIDDYMRLNYRNDIVEVGVNAGFNYQHARNAMQENANIDTWRYEYGGNVIVNMPWGTSLSSNISQQCRRGYQDESMNTNELIWDAQLSQSFLKGRAATISVQWYDILRQRSSISRSISATMRSDTWTRAIHSYVMVHFIYRLNLMGGRQARSEGFGPGRGEGPGGPGGGRGGWGGRF